MRKSIASEYFGLSLALVAASVVCMAVALISFSVNSIKEREKEHLEGLAVRLEIIMSDHGHEYPSLESQTAGTDTEIILFNSEGDVLVCSGPSPCLHSNKISYDRISLVPDEGEFSVGTVSGFYDAVRNYYLCSTEARGQKEYILVSGPAGYTNMYAVRITIIFILVMALIMVITIPVLKYSVSRILSPVKEMTLAAKRFGDGDFSEKVDIYEQNELGFLANSLNEMANSLEEIEENRKSFVSNVSHELRTPMTTIGGFVDGILDGTIPEKEHRKYLTTVSEEVSRLARLVRSMLNISKYEAGELELQTENFDVVALTIKTVLLFEKRIESRNIDIRGLDSDRLFVKADMDLVQQVIYNLTENAVKFVNEGGYISYSFAEENGRVVITVRNSGEGLKKNEMNKVFDRFYKTDESRGKDKMGVGLGLSIVRSIIKLHDGQVTVRSKQGEYTEFEFTLGQGERPERRERS